MYNYGNLIEVIKSNSINSMKGITFVNAEKDEKFLSYKELYNNALKLLHHFRSKGIKPKDEVVFQLDNNEEFITVFWACILGGITPVPITVGNNDEHRLKLFRICKVLNNPYLAANNKNLSSIKDFASQKNLDNAINDIVEKALIIEEVNLDNEEASLDIYEPQGDDIAVIQFSSGSTGDPKGVILTHDNLLTNIRAIINCSKTTSDDSMLNWVPLTHDMGLILYYLTGVVACLNQYLMPTKLFVQSPTVWMKKVSEHKVTQLYSPNFGYKHFLTFFNPENAIDWDLSSVRLIYNGAEPISDEVCNSFLDRMALYGLKRNSMFPVYGMAEASVLVTHTIVEDEIIPVIVDRRFLGVGQAVRDLGKDNKFAITLIDVGTSVDDCLFRVCDGENNVLRDNVVGYIQIKGRNVTSGYYNNKEATSRLISECGWLNTGDLGFIRNGRLVVTGRAKDLIIINGQNYYPHDIERVAEDVDGIELGRIVACGVYNKEVETEELILFVYYKRNMKDFIVIANNLMKTINEKIGLKVGNVVPVKRIPKTTSGKVQRYRLGEKYLYGEFDDVIKQVEMLMKEQFANREIINPQNSTEEKIVQIWQEILGIERISTKDSFFELGANSLKASILTFAIQKEFSVDITLRDIFKYKTIEALAMQIDNSEKGIYTSIKPVCQQSYYPMSSNQKRLFVLNQIKNIGTSYNIPVAMLIEGKLDMEHFENVLKELVNRHESLRTSFDYVNGQPVQIVHKNVEFKLDYEVMATGSVDNKIREFIKPFELNKAPLIRAKLVKIDDDRHVFILDMHHIVVDGISVGILFKEIKSLYVGESLSESSIHYKDFSAWKNMTPELERIRKQKDFWLDTLSGELPVLNLITDYARPSTMCFDGERVFFEINSKLTSDLNLYAVENGVTLFMILLAAYTILLSKYAQQEDILIGSALSGRQHADVQNLVGMFVDTVVIRSFPQANKTFKDFLSEVRDTVLKVYENQEYQFDDLINSLGIERDVSRNPLFDTMFVLQNMDIPQLDIQGLKFSDYEIDSKVSKFDILLEATEKSGKIKLMFEYCTGLFKRETIQSIGKRFISIIKDVLAEPGIKLNDIKIITEEEKKYILNDYNNTQVDYPKDITLHGMFKTQAWKTPDNIALVMGDSTMTYRTLDEMSDRVAHYLCDQGIGKNDYVCVLAERSIGSVVNVIAVLKTGAAYIPVDPEYPQERREYILKNSNSKLLLESDAYTRQEISNCPLGDIGEGGSPDDMAYVIYTSGTTGKPKGVMIKHKAACNTIMDINEKFLINGDDRIIGLSSMCFDLSVYDIFGALSAGAALVIIPDQRDPDIIRNTIADHKITIWNSVPAIIDMLLQNVEDGFESESLRLILLSGDWIPLTLPAKANRHFPNSQLISLGGATEGSIWSIYYPVSSIENTWRSIPYGMPLANQKFYVLDNELGLCPIGVQGELFIGGIGVAEGYINDEEKTRESFISHPEFGYLYRTGDYGVLTSEGYIVFMGRRDHQVKIRGYRVELDEIQKNLITYPGVKNALVLDFSDERNGKYLCAYVVMDGEVDAAIFKEHLSRSLPEYMIPSHFIKIDSIPLTSNGKPDRKAIPMPDLDIISNLDHEPPVNGMQKAILEVWQEVLEVDRIGITDGFTELGGHSIKAALAASKISKKINVKISLVDIFKCRTAKELAYHIENMEKIEYKSISSAQPKKYYSVSSAQKRLFVVCQLEGSNISYNMPVLLKFEGVPDMIRLENAVKLLINRHEALRTSFEMMEDSPVQVIHDNVDFSMDFIECMEESVNKVAGEFIRVFDLGKAPLLRGAYIKTESSRYLMLDMHHIISDAVTLDILLKELTGLYEGKELPEVRIQYKDFSEWQNSLFKTDFIKKQEEYWMGIFSREGSEIAVLDMPFDYQRPMIQSFEGDRIKFKIGKEISAKLYSIASSRSATLYMALLAAYNILLFKYTGQEDIVVGSPTEGRSHEDIKNTMGIFVNTLAMRNYIDGSSSFMEFLDKVRVNVLHAFENENYPFEELVEKLNIQRDMSRNPLFDTMFAMQNVDINEISMGSIKLMPQELCYNLSKFDLTLQAFEGDEGVRFELEYCTSLFKKETAERMAIHFINILESIVSNPESKISKINMLSDEERKQLIYDFNNTKTSYPKDKTIKQLFEEQVEATPDNISLVFGDSKLTYRQLNEKANQLANILSRQGIKPGTMVCLILERSIEMIIGILGVLKAGGSYLPIDFEYPEGRINAILEDSGVSLMLVQKGCISKVPDKWRNNEGCKTLILEELIEGMGAESAENLEDIANPEDLVYVIYTSGSTGKPKGSLTNNYNIVRVVKNTNYIDITENDTILQLSNYAFDGSTFDIYGALLNGAKLVLVSRENILDMSGLAEVIIKESVNVFFITTALFNALVDLNIHCLANIRKVLFGGERVSVQHTRKALEYMGPGRILHVYGPTESTVYATYYNVDDIEKDAFTVPIGKPLSNTEIYIMNKYNELVPVNVAGELCISGDGLVQGYLNRDELTREKFVPNPFMPGKVMYRTGDLARWLPDGNVEFCGRMDHQIKLRGFRIELGEIEAQLLSLKEIKEAKVIDRVDKSGSRYLCAYIVCHEEIGTEELREYLSRDLPGYMIPAYFIKLDSMLVNINGKIDIQALPEPSDMVEVSQYVAPTNNIEEKIAGVWAEVFAVPSIGITDNFFSRGGDSIKAIQISTRLRRYNIKMEVKDLFRYPVIKELANHVTHIEDKENFEDNQSDLDYTGITNEELGDLESYVKQLFK